MPQVPLYGPRKVETRPIAGVKRTAVPSAESFGAGFGDTLTRVAVNTAAPIIQEQRDKADQMVVLEASNVNAQWEADTLHHPTTGLLNTRKGKNAMGLPEEVMEGYEQFSNKLAERLTNDRQRLAFARIQAQTRDQIRSQVYNHVEREMNVFYDEQAKAGVGLRVSGAIQAYKNPPVSSQKMQEAVAITVDHLKGKGASDEAIRDAVLGVTSSVHEGVINQMLAVNQDKAAKVYFEEYNAAGQIDAEALQRITKSLEIGSLRGESQREADRIIAEGGTPTEMIAKADAITDPEVRDETRQRVEHHVSTAKALQRDAHEDMMLDASQRVRKNKSYDAIPESMLIQMDSTELARMQTFADSLQPGARPIRTDKEVYFRLRRMASDYPEKFKEEIFTNYITKLDDGDWTRLVELQADMRTGKQKAEKELDGIRTYDRIFEDTLASAGIDAGDTVANRASGQTAKVAAMHDAYDRQIRYLEQTTEHAVPKEEAKSIIDGLLKSVVLQEGSWFNILPGGQPFYEVTKQIYEYSVADIPKLDRDLIVKALLEEHVEPTHDRIIATWVEKRRQGK